MARSDGIRSTQLGIIRLDALRDLDVSMQAAGRSRCTFGFQRGAKQFSVHFITDIPEPLLLLARIGDPAYCELKLQPEFVVDLPLDPATYTALCKLLGLHYDPENPFRPTDFLRELNNAIPRHAGRTQQVEPADLVPFSGSDLEQPDRPYFMDWRHHNPPTSDVSLKNLDKTRKLEGSRIEPGSDLGSLC